jgi:hypothetical protein
MARPAGLRFGHGAAIQAGCWRLDELRETLRRRSPTRREMEAAVTSFLRGMATGIRKGSVESAHASRMAQSDFTIPHRAFLPDDGGLRRRRSCSRVAARGHTDRIPYSAAQRRGQGVRSLLRLPLQFPPVLGHERAARGCLGIDRRGWRVAPRRSCLTPPFGLLLPASAHLLILAVS